MVTLSSVFLLVSGIAIFGVFIYRLTGKKSEAAPFAVFATMLIAIGVFCFWIDASRSFAPQLTNGEEATVLAVIPAAESSAIDHHGLVIIYSEVPRDYRYVLILKNNKGKERREFWNKPDSVLVGCRIGRLKSGLVLVQTANTGS